MYHRILIVGSTASGKTTLANKISSMLNLPVYSTDDFVYKEKHTTKYSEQERNDKLKSILKKKNWINEGVHSSPWFVPAFQKADLVIVLCLPRWTLFKRVIVRNFERKKKFEGLFFLLRNAYIYKNDRFVIHTKLAKECGKKTVILRNAKEIQNFILSLPD